MLRTAFRLGVLCAIAGCAAPAGPPREAPRSSARTQPRAAASEASALAREADQHAATGRRDLAAPLYARATGLRDAEHSRVPEARALAELAVTLHDRGHLPEAEHFYRRALAEQAVGGADPELRTLTLANLGWLLGERAAAAATLGNAREAGELYEQALGVWEFLQPASDELVAETLANLALLHRARGEHDRARAFFERALPLYEKTLAANDPTVVRVRGLLADYALRANPPYETNRTPRPSRATSTARARRCSTGATTRARARCSSARSRSTSAASPHRSSSARASPISGAPTRASASATRRGGRSSARSGCSSPRSASSTRSRWPRARRSRTCARRRRLSARTNPRASGS